MKEEYVLKYKDALKLEGIGWIEFVPFFHIYIVGYEWVQLSI